MRVSTWLTLVALCVFTNIQVKAGSDIVIYYDGRPGITYQNVPGLNYIFFEIDRLRERVQQSVASEVNGIHHRFDDVSFRLKEDFSLELLGLSGQKVRLTADGLGSNLFFKYRCPVHIRKARVNVSFDRAVITTNYDLVTGNEPYHADLQGFDARIRTGINVCTLAGFYNWFFGLFGADFESFIIRKLEDRLEDEIEGVLQEVFNLEGLGFSFLDLDPYVQAIPNNLFDAIGVSKTDLLNTLRNPFSGIRLKIEFDEDGVGYNGDNDKLKIWVDVPWEDPPRVDFSYRMFGETIRLDASASYDPDGGSLHYQWIIDSRVYNTLNPVLSHTFSQPGGYSIILIVTDDEGVKRQQSQYVNTCEGANNNVIDLCNQNTPN